MKYYGATDGLLLGSCLQLTPASLGLTAAGPASQAAHF